MNKVKIKHLSVNGAWQGRRYKTAQYKTYESDLMWLLPKITIPEGKLKLEVEFGVSNKLSDWDNGLKPFCDILQKQYGFNDNQIYEAIVRKVVVAKGEEYIAFELTPI